MNKPSYPHAPIASLSKLALALSVTEQELIDVAYDSDQLFFQTRDIKKADGSHRYTYDTKPRLKRIHGKICEIFLKRAIYPEYLQGSLKRKDYLTDAKRHIGTKILICEDMTNFFPSISKKIIHELWVGVFGFSNEVANCLSELVTMNGYLVQGAKTSSYLCNLVLWNREAILVEKFKRKGITYTRYVDDITVSSKRIISKNEKKKIIGQLYAMFHSINVKPNRRKHKILPAGKRQAIHGVNVNASHVTMPKKERDKIRSAVHQCEQVFSRDNVSVEYEKLFNSTMGRVATMQRMHKSEADKLKKRLYRVKPPRAATFLC